MPACLKWSSSPTLCFLGVVLKALEQGFNPEVILLGFELETCGVPKLLWCVTGGHTGQPYCRLWGVILRSSHAKLTVERSAHPFNSSSFSFAIILQWGVFLFKKARGLVSGRSRNLWKPCCPTSFPFAIGSLPVWSYLWFAMMEDMMEERLWSPSFLEMSCKSKWILSQWNQMMNESIRQVHKSSHCFQGEGVLKSISLIYEETSLHRAAELLWPWHFPLRQPVVIELSMD